MKKSVGGTEYFVIPANQSAWYMTREDAPEQKLRYFTEDVGLNTFYFLVNHVYPPFMQSLKYNLLPSRGEYYFFMHKQLLTRYVVLWTFVYTLISSYYIGLKNKVRKQCFQKNHILDLSQRKVTSFSACFYCLIA